MTLTAYPLSDPVMHRLLTSAVVLLCYDIAAARLELPPSPRVRLDLSTTIPAPGGTTSPELSIWRLFKRQRSSSTSTAPSSALGTSSNPASTSLPSTTPTTSLISSSASGTFTTSSSPSDCLTQAVAETGSSFDPTARTNVAAYFGHATGTSNASLANLCNQTSVDIVILGFVRSWVGPGWYPNIDFHKTCTYSQVQAGKSIPRCPTMANWISACQLAGKKVFLSIGGSTANVSFSRKQDAYQQASTLWTFFGNGPQSNVRYGGRPFWFGQSRWV